MVAVAAICSTTRRTCAAHLVTSSVVAIPHRNDISPETAHSLLCHAATSIGCGAAKGRLLCGTEDGQPGTTIGSGSPDRTNRPLPRFHVMLRP
jgi:hypothetical protein